MKSFAVHSETTAPEGSREMLAAVSKGLGFVPNLMGVLAGAPAALEAYLTLSKLFDSTSLTTAERQVVLLSVSFENGCDYCMAAHSGLALMQGVPGDVVGALRDGTPISEARLEALRTFTASVTRRRATVPEAEVEAFIAAGFSRQQLLEVLVGVTQKTLSNYVNHLAHTPLDAAFKAHQWSHPDTSGEA
jgi:uncharacterized peroxidase-related enzyme